MFCDCKSLKSVFKTGQQKVPNHDMLCDWVAQILEYHPKVIHKPGKLMAIPDALSHQYVGYHDKATSKDYVTHWFEELVSSGRVWWKKIAEKRKERCKLHSMARARNVRKKQSLSRVYLQTGFNHIFVNVTPSAKAEKHTQIKAHIRDTKIQQV